MNITTVDPCQESAGRRLSVFRVAGSWKKKEYARRIRAAASRCREQRLALVVVARCVRLVATVGLMVANGLVGFRRVGRYLPADWDSDEIFRVGTRNGDSHNGD